MTIFKNTNYYLLAGILPMTIGFLLLPIYTRYLSVDEYGILSVVSVFTNFTALLVGLSLHSGISRLFFDKNEFELKEYFSTLVYAMFFVGLIAFGLLYYYGDVIIDSLYDQVSYYPYFFISTIQIFFMLIISITTAFLKVRKNAKVVMYSIVIPVIVSSSLSIYLVIFLSMGVIGILYSGLLTTILTFLSHIIYFRKEFILKFKYKFFIENLKFGLPVIPYGIGAFAFTYADVVILEKYVSLAAIGIYFIADKFARILKVLINSFSQAYSPIYMQDHKESIDYGQTRVKEFSKSWFTLLTLTYVSLIFISENAIFYLLPKEYHLAIYMIPILLLSYIIQGVYLFNINHFYYLKQTKYLPMATFTGGVLNIVLNLLIIPYYGVWGAIATTVFSFFITWIILIYLQKRFISMNYDKTYLKNMFLVIGVSLLLFYLFHLVDVKYRMILELSYLSLMVWVVYRYDIGLLKKFIKRLNNG